MANITVKLTAIDSCNPPVYCGCTFAVCTPITYTIRNICTLSYNLDMPVEVISIPETQVNTTGTCQVNCEGAGPIILKIVGNTMTMCINWTLMDEDCTVVTGGTPSLPTISTAEDQLKFLLGTFQNRSINYAYTICASGLTNVGALLTNVSATLTKSAPVTYNANMKFVIGDNTISVSEGDTT